jgi:hypothetical protein
MMEAVLWFLVGLLFNREDGGDVFFQIVGSLSKNYMALHTRRYSFS